MNGGRYVMSAIPCPTDFAAILQNHDKKLCCIYRAHETKASAIKNNAAFSSALSSSFLRKVFFASLPCPSHIHCQMRICQIDGNAQLVDAAPAVRMENKIVLFQILFDDVPEQFVIERECEAFIHVSQEH